MKRRSDERGHVLIFVLGLLALSALLAVALANLLRLENAASTNLILGREARIAAEAGLERALYQLGRDELRDPISSFHRPSVYRSQDGATWGADQPLWDALNPSFKQGTTEHGFAHSGRVARAAGDTVFKLRVVDCASRINLNGTQRSQAQMLDALGRAIREFAWRRRVTSDPLHDAGYAQRAAAEGLRPRDPVAGRGARIVALRRAQPQRTFTDWEALEQLLGEDDLALLRPFVTISSPYDRNRRLHPVNVNTATWPVLVAVLEGLSRDAPPSAGEVTPPLARLLADAFDARRRDPARGPFQQISELRAFWLETLQSVNRSDAADSLSSLVPNYAPDGWPGNGPADYPAFHDCRVTTVPFRLSSFGRFEVTSLGVVFDKEGKDLAQVELSAIVSVYDMIRLNTQEDFEVVRSRNDTWDVETFPNPVGPLAGPRRFRMDTSNAIVFSHRRNADRRTVRWEISSGKAGYLMASALEPGVPSLGPQVDAHVERVHVFRFNADLTGSVFQPNGRLVVGAEHQPLGQTYTDLYGYGYGLGTHPYDLGDIRSAPNPNPQTGRANNVRTYAPDGYVTRRDRREDLYYRNNDPDAAGPILTGSGMISLQYKTQEFAAEWTPLFEARVRPGKEYTGLNNATDFVDIQVLVRSGPSAPADDDEGEDGSGAGAFKIELLTRFVSTTAPTVAPDPTLPPTLALNQRIIEQVHQFPGLTAGKWVTIQIPYHLNAHVPTVNGALGTPVAGVGVAAPTWPPYAEDTVSPGGYGGGTRGAMADTSIDNVIVVNLNNNAGLALVRGVLAGTTQLTPTDRFTRVGPDHIGSFTADLPPVEGGRVRFGELLWESWIPKSFQTVTWEPCDWMVQATYGFGTDAPRRQLTRRPLDPPRANRLSDPYVRYWWLRYLRQHEARLGVTVAHYDRLLRLASDPRHPDPPSQKTYTTLRDALTARRDAVTQRIQAVVGSHGEAQPVREPAHFRSVAFGAPRWRSVRRNNRIRLKLDFVVMPDVGTQMTSAVSEVLLPYQSAPRILSVETVD